MKPKPPYVCYDCKGCGSEECIDKGYAYETNDTNFPLCFESEKGFKTCLICGEKIENDEEILWGHIQMEHEEQFEEVQDWESPDMIDEYYEDVNEIGGQENG